MSSTISTPVAGTILALEPSPSPLTLASKKITTQTRPHRFRLVRRTHDAPAWGVRRAKARGRPRWTGNVLGSKGTSQRRWSLKLTYTCKKTSSLGERYLEVLDLTAGRRLVAADAGTHALVVVSGPNPAYTELARPKVGRPAPPASALSYAVLVCGPLSPAPSSTPPPSMGTAYSTATASSPDPVAPEPPASGRSTGEQEMDKNNQEERNPEEKEAGEAAEEETAQIVLR